jgi:hypothetical protein
MQSHEEHRRSVIVVGALTCLVLLIVIANLAVAFGIIPIKGSVIGGISGSICASCLISIGQHANALRKGRSDQTAQSLSQSRFPRMWQLFPFLLSREVRERVYEPSYQDLLEDYVRAQALRTTKMARWWLWACFSIRTIGLLAGSIGAATGVKFWRIAGIVMVFLFGREYSSRLYEAWVMWRGRL